MNLETKQILFVDIDGVLADFEGYMKNFFNVNNLSEVNNFWVKGVINNIDNKPFENFKLMSNAKALIKTVEKYDPILLTSTGSYNELHEKVKVQKTNWLKKHFPQYANSVIFVNKSKQKSKFAGNDNILIDDSENSIKPFTAKGGRGILYKDGCRMKDLEKAIDTFMRKRETDIEEHPNYYNPNG